MKFSELGLSPETLKAVKEVGYESPTPIQAQAIPLIQMTRDVVGLAQTGTGKTASFTLPMIDALSGGRAKMRMPRSLILEPTRELAAQVAENFDTYGKYHKLSKVLLVGGVSMGDQMKALEQGVDVLIATPGRLLDLFGRGSILLNDIRILVIDEADRMLDMGFIPDIEKIVKLIPPTRQTLLFSATMPDEIKRLTDQFLSNPKEVRVAPEITAATTVQQYLVETQPKKKRDVLYALLKRESVKNAFIFLNRKRDIDSLTQWLKSKGFKAAGLHGDMVQKSRTDTLQDFKDDKVTLLVCSDVAARGLDIKGVSHVFNYDVPMNADDYVHRIGRTGRAGMEGSAWMIATNHDEKYLEAIEKLTRGSLERITLEDQKESGKGKSADKESNRISGRTSSAQSPKKSSEKPSNKRMQDKGCDDDVVGFGDDIPSFLR